MDFKGKFDPIWINERIDKNCVDFTEELGKFLCDINDRGFSGPSALTTSQIRNFFGEVKRIQLNGIEKGNNRSAFLLIRPKLAYAEARAKMRNSRSRITIFKEFVQKAHAEVDTNASDEVLKTSFQNFVDFLESILAYHKSYGGRD
jgi:CRISPR-associated protein Csm2